MTIAGFRFAQASAAAALIMALAGCTGLGNVSSRPSAGPVTEQARLRLTDQCMYEAAKTANMIKDKTSPRCQCYARGVVRQLSASEAASVAAGGSVPFTVRSQDIMSACASHPNGFTDATPRQRVKKKKKTGETPPPTEEAPDESPSADEPPSASPPTSGGNPPKSQ